MNKNIKKMLFEDTVKELKETISKMQGTDISLENLVENYATGLQLKQHAHSLLNNAKLKIQKIQQNDDEDTVLSNLSNKLSSICEKFIAHVLKAYKDDKKNPNWEDLSRELDAEFCRLIR